jgi:hypothetical protein
MQSIPLEPFWWCVCKAQTTGSTGSQNYWIAKQALLDHKTSLTINSVDLAEARGKLEL